MDCAGASILLCRYGIELARAFFIEDRAFGLVAAAPVLVTTWNSEKIPGPDTLFACVILI